MGYFLRAIRKVAKRIPGASELHLQYAAWRVRRRRQRRWEQARLCVVSFPKSGRTWLNVMFAKVISDSRQAKFCLDIPGVLFTHDNSDKPDRPVWVDARAYANKKVVFLSRDPRDIMASYYSHRTRRDEIYTGSISDFIRDSRYGLVRVITFMNAWWAQRHIPRDFLLLRYEDLKIDPRGELNHFLEFAGMSGRVRVVEDAVAFASFEGMLEMERKGALSDPRLRPANAEDPESYKVRKAVVGGYRRVFSQQDIAFLDEMVARDLEKNFGY